MSSIVLPTLNKGDKGDAVRFLEQILAALYWTFDFPVSRQGSGYIDTEVDFDAVYDDSTVKAVKEFQDEYNRRRKPAVLLAVDGSVGPETWKALGDAIYHETLRT